ncbi:G-protein coupled receptor Mth [Octopus bimaculoides]|uniref:G-protein coupled receptors family 2 profile 2 domain-containing protein n=1 Tax=Octopus bimaculoides TaxID=37653 RepID=A0A0L8H6C9_OCTBM|nr:G-protein coupled receptor Mth [Octopus bimaculoides]|eukprot:XP_014775026.1 PREDICTED: G-protein coupled receptor Mth-like [Octopus bimaculoides]
MFQYSKNLLIIFLIALGDEVIQQSSCFTNNPECNPTMCISCSCNNYCYLYNECCSHSVNQTIINQRTLSTDYSCRKIDANSYFMFDRCPSDHSFTEHITYCEAPDENDQLYNIPAFGKQTKRLYRNLFCALCNGEEYILWTVHYKCNQVMDIDFSLFPDRQIQNHCQVLFEAPSDYTDYKYQCIHYVAKCPPNVTNTSLVSSCMFGPMAIVESNGTTFRNTHCAICNGIHINDILCNASIYGNISYGTPRQQYPLTIIFNYNNNNFEVSNNGQHKLYSKKLPSCSQGFIYDEKMKQCRQVYYNSILNCTAKRLEKSEYYITSDGYLYLNASHILLNQSAFIQDPQGISICVNNRTEVMGKYYTFASYITLVGLVTSIPALFITIIVYFCIPDLLTLPGKLLISLLVSLFTAELLLLISPQVTSSSLCSTIAIMMHYFFLAAFFWMNVMSFDAWYTFSGFTPLRSTEKDTKRLVYYSLYAWICPLIIVTVSLIFQYAPGNHGLSPEYGKGFFCWITNIKSRLWLFAAPVIIILLLNICSFILTARGLYLASKNSSKYLEVKNKTKFKVYFKLSLLMGLTWIFSFFPKLNEIGVVFLISCILNSFTGLIISIFFLSTKIVRRHFRLKCYQRYYKKECKHTDISISSNKTQLTNVHI